MTSTCTISIRNQSGASKSYLLFMEAPTPANVASYSVSYNVYDRSPRIESGNNESVNWECSNEFFAISGTAQTRTATPKFTTSRLQRIRLGPQGSTVTLKVDGNGNTSFDDRVPETTMSRGAFGITTGEFNYPNEYNNYIGFGARAPRGGSNDIVPLQTWTAEPGARAEVFPTRRYLVCTGEYERGSLVKRNTIGRAIRIDFSNATNPKIALYQNASGEYVVEGTNKVITSGQHTTPNGVAVSVSDN